MSKENKIIKDLKERNDVLKNQYMQEQARNYHLNYVVDKYKSVLDEIREVLNNQMDYREFVDVVNAIDEILDKVESNDSKRNV